MTTQNSSDLLSSNATLTSPDRTFAQSSLRNKQSRLSPVVEEAANLLSALAIQPDPAEVWSAGPWSLSWVPGGWSDSAIGFARHAWVKALRHDTHWREDYAEAEALIRDGMFGR